MADEAIDQGNLEAWFASEIDGAQIGLVLTVGVGLCSGSPFAALGIGVVLMALIYAGGLRSGAHFNPAITLAAAMWGRISYSEAAGYWLAQLAAGLCAAITTRLVVGSGQSRL